jgi:hypothetical protein
MGVSSLTHERRDQTGSQTKGTRKRKARLKETEWSAGTSSGGFAVPVNKQHRVAEGICPWTGQEKKGPTSLW